jgi:hypothetical protein
LNLPAVHLDKLVGMPQKYLRATDPVSLRRIVQACGDPTTTPSQRIAAIHVGQDGRFGDEV